MYHQRSPIYPPSYCLLFFPCHNIIRYLKRTSFEQQPSSNNTHLRYTEPNIRPSVGRRETLKSEGCAVNDDLPGLVELVPKDKGQRTGEIVAFVCC